jgi:hypothetical protein
VTTLVRGQVVWDDGEVKGRAGDGRFQACGRPDMARPKSVQEGTVGRYMFDQPDAIAQLARERP